MFRLKILAPFVFILPLLSSCASLPQGAGADSSAKALSTARAEQASPAPAEPQHPVLEMTPELFYQLLVAEIAWQRGRPDVSVTNFEAVNQAIKEAALAERATRVALYARDDEAALRAAKQWVALAPNDLEARQLLVALLIRAKDVDGAVEQIEYILSSDQHRDDRLLAIAKQLVREPDKQMVVKVMERLVAKHNEDPMMLYVYSQLALNAGNFDAALAAIDTGLSYKPGWNTAIIQRASVLNARGNVGDALDYMQGMVKKYPKDDAIRLAYARMLVANNRLPEAKDHFKVTLKSQPDQPEVLYALAMISLQLHQPDEAEKYLLKLNQWPDYSYEAAFYLGSIARAHKNNYKEAISWYDRVEGGPNYFEAQLQKVLMIADQGETDLALAQLQNIQTENDEEKVRIYVIEGEILRLADRFQEAMDLYNVALVQFPNHGDLLYGRAMVAEKLNDLILMEQDLRKVIEHEPENAAALNALGYTLADRTERYQEAYKLVERAYALEPNNRYILDSMGWVYFRLGNYQEALKFLKMALEINADPEVEAHMIEVLWVSGDKAGARELYQRARGKKVIDQVMQRLEQKP